MEKGHFSDGAARSDTRFTKAVKAPNNFSSFSDFMGGRRRSGCDGYWPAGGQGRPEVPCGPIIGSTVLSTKK